MKTLMFILALASSPAFAIPMGGQEGNGGDMCENRFKVVRDDIHTWIVNGGSASLKLPAGISYGQYNQAMIQSMGAAKISCTDDAIYIGNVEKTCKNYVDNEGSVLINCNTSRFMNTSESDQYVLVHHEYAGLAGFEVNNGANSNYDISNQITGFLENQVVKKLVVKPPSRPGVSDPFDGNACSGAPITNNEFLSYFKVGGNDVQIPANTAMIFRDRKCLGEDEGSCTDWRYTSSGSVGIFLSIQNGKAVVDLETNIGRCGGCLAGSHLNGVTSVDVTVANPGAMNIQWPNSTLQYAPRFNGKGHLTKGCLNLSTIVDQEHEMGFVLHF